MTAPSQPVGALRLWHREIRAGVRSPCTDDALSRAAAWEASAEDAVRCGDMDRAGRACTRAVAILAAAAKVEA